MSLTALTNLFVVLLTNKLGLDMATSMLLSGMLVPVLHPLLNGERALLGHIQSHIQGHDLEDYATKGAALVCCGAVAYMMWRVYKARRDRYNIYAINLTYGDEGTWHVMETFVSFEKYHPGALSTSRQIFHNGKKSMPEYGTRVYFTDPVHKVRGYLSSRKQVVNSIVEGKTFSEDLDVIIVAVNGNTNVPLYLEELFAYVKKRKQEDSHVQVIVDHIMPNTSRSRELYYGKKNIEAQYEAHMKPFFSPHKERLWEYAKAVAFSPDSFLKWGQHAQMNLLLYGPPGTGKSSFAQRLSMCTFKSIRVINLIDFVDSVDYLQSVFRYSGIILMDELDNAIRFLVENKDNRRHVTLKKKDDVMTLTPSKRFLTLPDLLDIIQGAIVIPGRIVIGITNDFDYIFKQCPALFRPGRLTPVHFDYLDWKTLQELTKHYFGQELSIDPVPKVPIPTSQIVELAMSIIVREAEENRFAAFERDIQPLLLTPGTRSEKMDPDE